MAAREAAALVLLEDRGAVKEWADAANPAKRYLEISASSIVPAPVSKVEAGELEVTHGAVKAVSRADGVAIHADGTDRAVLRLIVEQLLGKSWISVGPSAKAGQDAARRAWNFGRAEASVGGDGKWTFAVQAAGAGTYRLKLILDLLTPSPVNPGYARVNGAVVMAGAEWPGISFDWADMRGDVAEAIVSETGLVLTTAPFDLKAGETKILDPTFGPQSSSWSSAIMMDGTKLTSEAEDWCGGGGGSDYARVAVKFDITSLPADATVTQVDLSIYVASVGSASALTWDVRPYHTDNGQADPAADTGSNAFTRSDNNTTAYIAATTQFRTTGQKTFTNLGATANSHVQAARDAGTRFSFGISETTNTTSDQWCTFRRYSHGTTPPKLTIAYTAAGPVTGTGAGGLPKLAGSSAGKAVFKGSTARAFGPLAALSQGGQLLSGAASGALARLAQAAAGGQLLAGTVAAPLPGLEAGAAGRMLFMASSGGSLAAASALIAAVLLHAGSAAAELGAVAGSGAGGALVLSQGAPALPALAASAAGDLAGIFSGALAADLAGFDMVAGGDIRISAAASSPLAALLASAAGTAVHSGGGASLLAAMAAAMAGLTGESGVIVLSMPNPASAAAGLQRVPGLGSPSLAAPLLAGSGAALSGGLAAALLSAPLAGIAGLLLVPGAGAIFLPRAVAAGEGHARNMGALAALFGPPALAGQGHFLVLGGIDADLTALQAALSGWAGAPFGVPPSRRVIIRARPRLVIVKRA